MTDESRVPDEVPKGFRPPRDIRKVIVDNPGSHVVAVAYDCTGEKVDSVWEAHTVVIRVYIGSRLLYQSQVAGSPSCSV